MHVMQRVLTSYCPLLCFAPFFDQALVSGRWVTRGEVIDDRFVQLQTTETSTCKIRVRHAGVAYFLDDLNACRPDLDDGVGERVRDDVEQVGGVLAGLDVEGIDQEQGEFVQNPRGGLQGQEDQHRQPVEEVVDCSASKCPGSEQTVSDMYQTLFADFSPEARYYML